MPAIYDWTVAVVFGVWCIIENGKHTRAPHTHVRMNNVPDLFFRLKIAVDAGGVRSRLAYYGQMDIARSHKS